MLAALAPLLVVVVAVVVVRAATSDDAPADQATQADVVAYQEAVHPLTVEWGKIEILGMRPAIGDLREEGGVPAPTIAGEARHWQATLASLRERLAAVAPPPGLERAAALFDESIALYIEAARIFERAATEAPGPAQDEAVADGIDKVREGTARFNEAGMALQSARKRVGLGPTDDFPKEPAS